MNGLVRFTFTLLLIGILAGCAEPTQILPTPTATLPSPTATLQIPTPTPKPTVTQFVNLWIYDIPEMYQVNIETVQYPTLNDPSQTLPMYIFYPPDRQADQLLPAVLLVNAWKQNGRWLNLIPTLGLLSNFEGWGRIIAANGLIAVAYETLYPNDLEAVVNHIQQNSSELGIDGNRLGLYGMSSTTVPEGAFAYQENREYLKFAVFYYGNPELPDAPGKKETDDFCAVWDCYSVELPEITQLRTDLPVLLVRCGDDSEVNLADIDYFIRIATEQGVPLTLIRFDEGSHGFDYKNKSFGEVKTKGIEIIKQTIEFMKSNAFAP